jgi:hypothetical protein
MGGVDLLAGQAGERTVVDLGVYVDHHHGWPEDGEGEARDSFRGDAR